MKQSTTTNIELPFELPGPIRAVHEWMAAAPEHLDNDHTEFFAVTNWAMFGGLTAHMGFLALFLALGLQALALFNVGSVALFAFTVVMARQGRVMLCLSLAAAEVTAHAMFATHVLGWGSSFHYYIIILIVLFLLFGSTTVRMRVGATALFVSAYLGLSFYAIGRPPQVEVAAAQLTGLSSMNLATFLWILVGICGYYAWAVKQTRAQLAAALQQSRELERMKTNFTSTVSHELRTPLTSVVGFAKLIRKRLDERVLVGLPSDEKRDKAAQQVRSNVDIIIAEGERLTELVTDVLDIARLESGRMEWEREPFKPSDLARKSFEATQGLFLGGDVGFEAHVDEGLPALTGDIKRLQQVLINFISNAQKFTPNGSVFIEVHAEDDGVRFGVRDTGDGIAAEHFEVVFDRFQQVHDVLTDKPRGTGLGLPICAHIVRAHGSQIDLDSELGTGSTFSFLLKP